MPHADLDHDHRPAARRHCRRALLGTTAPIGLNDRPAALASAVRGRLA